MPYDGINPGFPIFSLFHDAASGLGQASKIRNKCLGIPLEYALAYHEKVLTARMRNGLSDSPSAGSSWFLMLETGDFCNRKGLYQNDYTFWHGPFCVGISN